MKEFERIGTDAVLVTDGALKYIKFESLDEYGDTLVIISEHQARQRKFRRMQHLNLGFKGMMRGIM